MSIFQLLGPEIFLPEIMFEKMVLKPEENGNFLSGPASKLELSPLLGKAQGMPGEFWGP